MKIRLFFTSLALLASAAQAPGLQARELSVGSSSDNEYVFLINLITTFGNNLSSRDAATELNDSPTLVTNNYASYVQTSSDNGTSSRLIRNDERLGAFNWILKDGFNKDKLNLFDNKEYVDAGIPEYGFLKGFSEYFSQAVLQTSDSSNRLDLNTTTENTDGEFQF